MGDWWRKSSFDGGGLSFSSNGECHVGYFLQKKMLKLTLCDGCEQAWSQYIGIGFRVCWSSQG